VILWQFGQNLDYFGVFDFVAVVGRVPPFRSERFQRNH
jgi:hypothetical protein